MVYHLQVVSSITGNNTKSRHINIELDNDYQNFQEIEMLISEKFHITLSELKSLNKNEYLFNLTDENRRVHDYLIRIEEH